MRRFSTTSGLILRYKPTAHAIRSSFFWLGYHMEVELKLEVDVIDRTPRRIKSCFYDFIFDFFFPLFGQTQQLLQLF